MLVCSSVSLVAKAFGLNPSLVPAVSPSVTCCALVPPAAWVAAPGACFHGNSTEMRDNFLACWTAREAASGRVENQRKGRKDGDVVFEELLLCLQSKGRSMVHVSEVVPAV